MFDLIAFVFKIIFSAIIGGVFSYAVKKSVEDQQTFRIDNMIMVSVMASSLVSLAVQFPDSYRGIAVGASILSSLYITVSIIGPEILSSKIQVIFSAIIGIIIGAGHIFQACILCLILFVILNNSLSLINAIYDKKNDVSDTNLSN